MGSDEEERKRKRSHKDKKEKHKDKDRDRDRDKHKKHKKEATVAVDMIAGCKPCDISEDDYFAKAREFQQWLVEARSTFLDEVASDEARRLFKKFVSKWNSGTLSQAIYDGKSSAPAASRTRHQWGFATKLSDADQMQLDRTVDGVGSQTNLGKAAKLAAAAAPARSGAGPARGPSGPIGPAGPSRPPTAAPPPQQQRAPAPQPARVGSQPAWDPEAFKRSMGM